MKSLITTSDVNVNVNSCKADPFSKFGIEKNCRFGDLLLPITYSFSFLDSNQEQELDDLIPIEGNLYKFLFNNISIKNNCEICFSFEVH